MVLQSIAVSRPSPSALAPTPRFSIVTPSLQQCAFLKVCVASVEMQGTDDVEQIIVDGGSTDGTVEFLERRPGRVERWQSGPDRGQGHALNMAIALARGEWIGWQNADDYYFPGALARVAALLSRQPAAKMVVGDVALVDPAGMTVGTIGVSPVAASRWVEGFWPYNQGVIFHRSVLAAAGPLDEDLNLHLDTDLLARIARLDPTVLYVDAVLGAFRRHGAAKTAGGEADAASRAERELLEARFGRRLWPAPGWQRLRHRVVHHCLRMSAFGPSSLCQRLEGRHLLRPRVHLARGG
jgi:glycosyltransferase involved in cell wall biosynthesis